MFNWENEIKKFTPELKLPSFITAATGTRETRKVSKPVDVIITTYGTLRSDIKLMLEIPNLIL
jgi:SNF2 family DNA or RNA helicase